MSKIYDPSFDESTGLVHVPVLGQSQRAVMSVQAFQVLSMREDVMATPLRLANDHGAPAIRAKVLNPAGSDLPNTFAVAALLVPPGHRQKVITLDGDPFNLRPENLAVVPLPQFIPASPVRTGEFVCSLLAPVRS